MAGRRLSGRAVVIAALLPLLAALALGYAAASWSDRLSADLQLNFGYFDVDFQNAQTASQSPEFTVTPNVQAMQGDTDEDPNTNADYLYITATNAYPGANAEITVDVVNTGSVSASVSFSYNDLELDTDNDGSPECIVHVQVTDDSGNDVAGQSYTIASGGSMTIHIKLSVEELEDNACERQAISGTILAVQAVQAYP